MSAFENIIAAYKLRQRDIPDHPGTIDIILRDEVDLDDVLAQINLIMIELTFSTAGFSTNLLEALPNRDCMKDGCPFEHDGQNYFTRASFLRLPGGSGIGAIKWGLHVWETEGKPIALESTNLVSDDPELFQAALNALLESQTLFNCHRLSDGRLRLKEMAETGQPATV